MHNYKIAAYEHVCHEVAILAYFERGGLEVQRGGPHRSSHSRGNNGAVSNPHYCSKCFTLCSMAEVFS